MTLQFDWPPDVVERLSSEARHNGLSLDAYVLQTVIQRHILNGPALPDPVAQRKAREEAGRSIRELRKDNILGPELDIRHLIEEGRRF